MSTYRNINRLLAVFTLVALILVTSACGKTTSETAPTQTPLEEVASISEPTEEPTDIPEATSTPEPTATREPQYKILFVGTSLTHWIAKLAGSANPPLVIQADSIVRSSAPLETMWENTKAREMIGEGDYDVVVLQDALPHTDVDTFHAYTRKFVVEIRETGAEPVLFMTWSRRGITLEEIAQAYRDIATELGVDVAPVGFAWQRAMEERPELDMYTSDKTHPSIHGSYLAVSVVYATVFGEVGLAYLPSENQRVTQEEAAFLQRIAWETVQEYQAQQ
jgi:hypothetical protein